MKKYDLVVVGGGFAGVASSISASRQGASVLLIEKSNCLGGSATKSHRGSYRYCHKGHHIKCSQH